MSTADFVCWRVCAWVKVQSLTSTFLILLLPLLVILRHLQRSVKKNFVSVWNFFWGGARHVYIFILDKLCLLDTFLQNLMTDDFIGWTHLKIYFLPAARMSVIQELSSQTMKSISAQITLCGAKRLSLSCYYYHGVWTRIKFNTSIHERVCPVWPHMDPFISFQLCCLFFFSPKMVSSSVWTVTLEQNKK